jgi:hypothetical protein
LTLLLGWIWPASGSLISAVFASVQHSTPALFQSLLSRKPPETIQIEKALFLGSI